VLPNIPDSPDAPSGMRLGNTDGGAPEGGMGVVVWVDEVIFIKLNGTRMTRIARIRADLGFLINPFYVSSSN